MGSFFAYSLQTALCLAVFYLFYKVLLSRETFHRFNRLALLGILTLSFIIPVLLTFIAIPQGIGVDVLDTIEKEGTLVFSDMSIAAVLPEKGNILLSWILLIYLTGFGTCLIYSVVSIARILLLVTKEKSLTTEDGAKLIILNDKNVTPFSWMNYIVLSKPDYEEAGQTIITHEKVHIRLHHTYELILAQVCLILQWFNPAAWLFYRELQNLHEYEADHEVIHHGVDSRQYQLLLIKKAVGTRLYSMANSFNHNNLKKRITMMLQKKSNAWARLKYAYVLPLAATAVAVFAHPEISKQFDEISSAKITHFALITSDNDVKNLPEADFLLLTSEHSDALTANEPAHSTPLNAPEIKMPEDSVFTNVEKMPQFPGGDEALMKYLQDNIVYPQIAHENGIQGRVSCQFIVEKDGSVTNVEIVRGRDPSLDKEALRVLQNLPKFIPGEQRGQTVRTYFNVPVTFRLQNTEATPPSNNVSNNPTAETTQKGGSFVWQNVEQRPTFPGGIEALSKWINDNLVYPQIAHENGIQGRVACQFTIQADGSVTDVEVVKGRDPSLDKEAIRVLKKLPKFIPGKQNGEPVAVQVYFRFSNTDIDSKPIAQAELADPNAPKSPFTVYPNPVNDVLTIVIDQPAIVEKYAAAGKKVSEPTYEFRLYNVSGAMMLHTTAKINKVQINVSKIPAGNYFLHISDGIESKPEVKQIIIRH